MNPTIQHAGPPILEATGIPPPYGGGTRRSALLADSFGAASFQAFLDQAGVISRPMERPEEEIAAPPKSPRPLPEGRPLALAPPEELLPAEEAMNLQAESDLAAFSPQPQEQRQETPTLPQKAKETLKALPQEETPVILWNSLAALDPRVAIQALKGAESTGLGSGAGGKAGATMGLEQMLAQMRGNQPGGQIASFAAESLAAPPNPEGSADPTTLSMLQNPAEPPVDESLLKNMLQDPALATVNRLVTPQNQPTPSLLGESPNPNGLAAAQINGVQFSGSTTPDGGGSQQGMNSWGGQSQTSAVGGKPHAAGQGGQTLSANSPHFAEELANRVGRMRLISRPGMSDQVKITLDPKDLGEINMRLHLDDENRVHLMISAESEATKEMLNRQMSQLKEALAKQNLGFGEVMVEVHTQEKQQQGGGFAQQEGKGSGFSDSQQERNLTEPELKPGERILFSSNSSGLNVIA